MRSWPKPTRSRRPLWRLVVDLGSWSLNGTAGAPAPVLPLVAGWAAVLAVPRPAHHRRRGGAPPPPCAATWASVGACPGHIGRQAAHAPALVQLTAAFTHPPVPPAISGVPFSAAGPDLSTWRDGI
jgi:hypothetical protein